MKYYHYKNIWGNHCFAFGWRYYMEFDSDVTTAYLHKRFSIDILAVGFFAFMVDELGENFTIEGIYEYLFEKYNKKQQIPNKFLRKSGID